MATNNIGASIAALRKEKGITQEALAAVIGVSGQAVSKWESGGMPDAELFPAIADYFEVSIDRLFGRDVLAHTNIVDAFIDTLRFGEGDTWETLLERAFDAVWRMNRAMFDSGNPAFNHGNDSYSPIDEYLERQQSYGYYNPDTPVYSEIDAENGLFLACLNANRRYFLLMPEPSGGWEFDDNKILEIFRDLADEDYFRTLVYIHRKPQKLAQYFSLNYFERELNLTTERAQAVADKLVRANLAFVAEHDIDGVNVTHYSITNTSGIVPLLIFAEEVAKTHHSWHGAVHDAHRKWLK